MKIGNPAKNRSRNHLWASEAGNTYPSSRVWVLRLCGAAVLRLKDGITLMDNGFLQKVRYYKQFFLEVFCPID